MKRILIALLIACCIIGSFPSVAYADTDDPDSTPTIEEVNVYRNLLEDGDRLIVVYANIPYGTPPSTDVTDTFIWQLVDTDNTTVLGTTVGYAFFNDGYGYNVYAFYFSAADNLTWGEQYIIRLKGNPAVFDNPPSYDYYISASDYTSLTTSADNKVALAATVIALATNLNSEWGLDSDEYLTAEVEVGTVLSLYGEAFFRGAIYGLQGLAPRAFSVSVGDIEAPDREWDEEYSENLTSQWSGTWIETAQEAGAALFGTTYDLTSILLVLLLCVGTFVGNVMITQSPWDALVDVGFVGVICARLGLYPLGFLGLLVALAWIFIGIKIFGIGR